MFNNLFDLSFNRTGLQALGFYIAYFAVFIILAFIIGFVVALIGGGSSDVTTAYIGLGLSFCGSCALAIGVLRSKGEMSGGNIALTVGAVALSLIGFMFSLIPIAVMTTRPKQ